MSLKPGEMQVSHEFIHEGVGLEDQADGLGVALWKENNSRMSSPQEEMREGISPTGKVTYL